MSKIEKSAEDTVLIDVNVKYPDEELARKLNIKTSKRVIVIRRFLLDKGRKIAYDEKNIPYQRGLPLVENEISYATFPEIAAKKKSVFAIKKELTIRTGISDEYLSIQLKIDADEPVLIIEQRLLDEKLNPIGLGITKFAGEFIQLNAVSLI